MAVSEIDTVLRATVSVPERRRPGRPDTVNPRLLTLLRAEERARLPALIEPNDRRLDAGQALVLAGGVGALLWAALFAGARAAFG